MSLLLVDAHDSKDRVTDMQCLPDNLSTPTDYQSTDQGFEARLCTRMDGIRKLKAKKATS
jgi:putative ATPase